MYDSRKTYDSIDEESNALLPGSNNGSPNKSRPASKTGLMVNRILVILMLAGLVAVSIWLQSMQTALTEKLSTDEDKIQQLESTVLTQGMIIARFNESVTNKDVIGQLETMEDRWDQERTELFDQLNQTKLFVQSELDSTMVELASTVDAAEKEINQQVDEVKVNFEQYAAKTEHQFSMENNFMKYQVAGTFTILSCLISMWHMGSHSRKMNQPAIQRKILAILWMCPIYVSAKPN
jgi:HD-GYP domain-containing protein (c-di-GMP phosphodiesterase class II)